MWFKTAWIIYCRMAINRSIVTQVLAYLEKFCQMIFFNGILNRGTNNSLIDLDQNTWPAWRSRRSGAATLVVWSNALSFFVKLTFEIIIEKLSCSGSWIFELDLELWLRFEIGLELRLRFELGLDLRLSFGLELDLRLIRDGTYFKCISEPN